MKAALAFFPFLVLSVAVIASEPAWEESPYRVRIYVLQTEHRLPRDFVRTVYERCTVFWRTYWTVHIEEPAFELRERLRTEFAASAELPKDWEKLDKIFVADFSSEKMELREFDTATRWLGEKRSFPLGSDSKLDDVLVQGLHEVFSPLGRVEQSGADYATLLLRGKNLRPPATSIRQDIFLPFVQSLDRSAKLTKVERIPWTVLIAERQESESFGLRCRVESGVQAPLHGRRRGQIGIYALAVPTPPTPTQLQFAARSAAMLKSIDTLPSYSVFERIPDEKNTVFLGRTAVDGTFLLEPTAERLVRLLQVRDNTALIAQFPIVRGVEPTAKIPVPDDVVRLEAEAALLGIQEEMIDQVARRDILVLRAKKLEGQGEVQQLRDVRSELLRMKDAARYHWELDQLRERLHSEDPIVERRIGRMFKETRKMVDTYFR